ncbi:hypothetical protein Q5752_001235 [Cryptotrichosporon argae]
MSAPSLGMTEEELAAAEKRKKSFERSLAGPSVGKAGLARNQEEINRIIAEASKGSKFYNNQVRKDKELTERIEWFITKRDELLQTANLPHIEAEADRILAEVEALRDMTQTIVHVDMDAFYASVECQRDPDLKGKAFGVGVGVLTTASYEARKFGCRSGMAGFIAKKLCPDIILVPTHFDLYIEASKQVREVLREYDENLAMASLDEGYLNITPYMATHDMTARQVVDQLRRRVEERTSLTISAGVAPNKMLAKICSDKNKPNGVFELDFDRAVITRFMRDLPVRRIPGFGRVTERCLEGLGVETCGDIYGHRAELLLMDHWFGYRGLCKAYLGIADNHVSPGRREERKSVGVERTFRDKMSDDDIMDTLKDIAEELGKDLANLKYAGKTVTVKYKLHTFENKTRAQSVKKYISTTEEILPIAQELLKKELPLKIRLLGIRLSTLKDLTVEESGIKKNATEDTPNSTLDVEREVVDLSGMEEEEPLDEADYLPPDPAGPAAASDMKTAELGASRSGDTRSAGPVCPICAKALGAGTTNDKLNEHVDWCLNREAIKEASGSGGEKRKRGTSVGGDVGSERGGVSVRKKGKDKKPNQMGSRYASECHDVVYHVAPVDVRIQEALGADVVAMAVAYDVGASFDVQSVKEAEAEGRAHVEQTMRALVDASVDRLFELKGLRMYDKGEIKEKARRDAMAAYDRGAF